MKKLNILLRVAALIAVEVVLTRFFSINAPTIRLGFGFLPIALCGMLYGPIWAGAAAGIGDLLGAILFSGGPYFPGLTFSAVLTGVLFGLLLWRERSVPRLALAVGLNCLGVSFLLNTYWLSILRDTPYHIVLVGRIPQTVIMLFVQFTLLRLISRRLDKNIL